MGEGWVLCGFCIYVNLCIIGITVKVQVEVANNLAKGEYVADEKQGAKD